MNVAVILGKCVRFAVARQRMSFATASTEVILQLAPKSSTRHRCRRPLSMTDHRTRIVHYQLHPNTPWPHCIRYDCSRMDIYNIGWRNIIWHSMHVEHSICHTHLRSPEYSNIAVWIARCKHIMGTSSIACCHRICAIRIISIVPHACH